MKCEVSTTEGRISLVESGFRPEGGERVERVEVEIRFAMAAFRSGRPLRGGEHLQSGSNFIILAERATSP